MHAHKWAKDNNNRHSWKKKEREKKREKKAPLTNNDLPVLPIVGDLVTRAELGEAGAPHDEDNNPGHILGLGGPGGGVLAMPASISTTAIRNNMNE